MRPFSIIEAPSILGLKDTGVQDLPDAILATGLAQRLGAKRAGTVEPPPYRPGRDPKSGMLNVRGIAEYTPLLADAVEAAIRRNEFPVVLGGDCSILLGNLLALRRRGRFGLLFVDGHTDFYQPEANINGEAASSDLALATGRGPGSLTTFDTFERLVRDEDIVVLGFRDAGEQRQYGCQPLPAEILAFDLVETRKMGLTHALEQSITRLTRPELEGFWIHLDVDVLDDAIMPAVDYRLPGGFTWTELITLLRVMAPVPTAMGMELTIFNPRMDQDGNIAKTLAAALVAGLTPHPTTTD